MGVDYTPNHGIGYKIVGVECEVDEDSSVNEYLYELISNTKNIRYFETGEGNYTGEDNEMFIVIKKPLEYGLDLTQKKKELDLFISENKIIVEGEFDICGGLLVW